jgi:NAD(P)H-quinone oxidoreductase subunit 6
MEQFEMLKALAETNVESFMFYILATVSILLAYGVILDRTIIRSGFILIGVFGSICGLFLLLQAQFLALAQLMIYAVGITLVVVIALMLTNPRMENGQLSTAAPANQLGAFMVAVGLFMTIYLSVRPENWTLSSEPLDTANVQVLGRALTTDYSLPFEFASVLLLAALIGAVMLAKAEKPPKAGEDDFEYSVVEESAAEPVASKR